MSLALGSAIAVAAATLPVAPVNAAAPASLPVQDAPSAGADGPATASQLPGAAAEVHEVTLITGDRVKLTAYGPDGPYETEVFPADRPGGQAPMFLSQVGPAGVYVVPSDVSGALNAGLVDRELFNVSYLVEQGYADAESDVLPVIVSYPAPVGAASRGWSPPAVANLASRADRLPATSDVVGLASLNGAGTRVAKEQAGEFWQQLRGGPVSRWSASAQPRVWLDRKAEVVLDESVPLVGAPQAWAAGYDGTGTTVAVLDTGVDLNHPDLTEQVVAAESFVDGLPPQDGHGHGTHVASTVAGTGAAADGQFTGVAPGADLISGRVCNDAGQCPFSSMIAGMEWAAQDMDADIVSMSLGGDPTDGTDPLSQAVNSLTASTGTLFVIAAGNSGGDRTVESPGVADAALTVAATDKSDGLAGFSSRGPRFGDLALKPDIAAPGVAIVAARAAGTDLGTPVDDSYTSLSGTSMATPHVSGAAAILAQRYPGWSPEQLKAALMSTTTDAGHTVYQQGAGRLDVARAATQPVHATTVNLDFGIVVIPDDGAPGPDPITRQVSYANQSDQPVTLTLASSLAGTDGRAVPPGALSTDETVTVPAGGVATVDVTLDVTGLGRGVYSGAVVATDDATGARLTTPVGLVREPPKVTLTIRTLGRDGQLVNPGGTQLLDVSGSGGFITDLTALGEGVTAARVPEGVYSVAQVVSWVDQDSRLNAAWLFNPEVTVDDDTEVVLDARTATQVEFDTPQPSEPLSNISESFYQRSTADGQPFAGTLFLGYGGGVRGSWTGLWATPTQQVSVGEFRFTHVWTLGENLMEMSLLDGSGPELHPATPATRWSQWGLVDENGFPEAEQFRGTVDLPLVYVGAGTPEELAGVDVTGKLALVETPVCGLNIFRVEDVRDAGAAGIVAFPGGTGCPVPMQVFIPPLQGSPVEHPIGIRYAYLPTREGQAVRDLLADGPRTLRVTGAPAESSYLNVLKPYEEGRIPDSLHYTFTEDDLAVFDVDYHAPHHVAVHAYYRFWKADDLVVDTTSPTNQGLGGFSGPGTRREYVGPVAPDLMYTHEVSLHRSDGFGHVAPAGTSLLDVRKTVPDLLDTPESTQEHWFSAPLTPGPAVTSEEAYAPWGLPAPVTGACNLCRDGDLLHGSSYWVTGSPDNLQTDDRYWELRRAGAEYRLHRDGQEVPFSEFEFIGTPFRYFEMPDDTGDYRLELDSSVNDASWWFTSGPPEEEQAGPLGHVCWLGVVFGLTEGPCAPLPIVYVSYDLGDSLAMDNTVRAPGAHRFDVYAYHHPSPVPMPDIAGLKLWASYDGGEQWTPVRVRDAGDGQFAATVVHPPDHRRASDQVSLKVEAWDVDGNRIEQVTRDAFALTDVRASVAGVDLAS